MALGLPFGLLVEHFAGSAFQPLFAAVVIGLAILEALRLARARTDRLRGGALLLGLAGVVHGAYGTGGPLVVFVTGRESATSRRFAPPSRVWLVLNAVLVIGFLLHGWLSARTLGETVMLLPVVAGALALGEWCAARISDRPFRAFGAALLGAAGVLLLLRGG